MKRFDVNVNLCKGCTVTQNYFRVQLSKYIQKPKCGVSHGLTLVTVAPSIPRAVVGSTI